MLRSRTSPDAASRTPSPFEDLTALVAAEGMVAIHGVKLAVCRRAVH